jgi:hypothetical protein
MEPADPLISALEVLGLKPGASKEEIQDAFRRLSLRVHPDVCPSGAGLFRVLTEARMSALGHHAFPLPSPAPFTPTQRPAFNWFRARPGILTAGTPDGMISVVQDGEGEWFWSIPGGRTSLQRYKVPSAAREAAEAAYLKFFSNGG